MDNIAGTKSSLTWAVHISVAVLVLLWIFPDAGPSGVVLPHDRPDPDLGLVGGDVPRRAERDTAHRRSRRPRRRRRALHGGGQPLCRRRTGRPPRTCPPISVWGTSSREIDAYVRPATRPIWAMARRSPSESNGDYRWTGNEDDQLSGRGQRVFVTAESPPEFTLANYRGVLFDPGNREGMAKAFFNTLTVTIPATIIPILIAAFAAYALAWMEFPGRALLVAAVVVALLVVPLQLALIPLLSLHNNIGIGKGYLGSGWRIPALACRWRSTSCATTWSACRATSSRTPASTARRSSRSSPRSSCR
jgi:alpha-glucoside transport system permease protein